MLGTGSFARFWRDAAVSLLIAAVCTPAFALTGSGDSQVGLLDTMGPQITGLQFGQGSASPGESVTLTFGVSEVVDGIPYVSINGHGATFVSQAGNTYTYNFEVFPGGGGSTPADVHISASDLLGNTGALDDSSSFVLNFPALPAPVWVLTVIMMALGAIVTWRLRRSVKISLFMALFVAQAAYGQPPEVSNVHFIQQAKPGGGTEVVITYDLVSELCNCNVEVSLSKNAGADGFSFPVTSIGGDIAHVAPGTGKRIVWDVAADYPNEHIPQAQLRVTAVTRPDDLTPWKFSDGTYVQMYMARCQNNLKQMGIVFHMFDQTNPGGYWPKLSGVSGHLIFTEEELERDFCGTSELLLCPGLAEQRPVPTYSNSPFVYLGYAVRNDQDVLAFAAAYTSAIEDGGDFSGNLPGVTSFGNAVYRLRENLVPAAEQRQIPVMFDWPDNHLLGFGGDVLYMDGHCEFKHYPDEFPMTEAAISALAELAEHEPPTEWNNPELDTPYLLAQDPHGLVKACNDRLAEVQFATKVFANEQPGERLPRLSNQQGKLMFREDELFPHSLPNPSNLICPGVAPIVPEPRFDDQHFAYLGYVMLNDADVLAFVNAYHDEIDLGGDFSGNLTTHTSYGNSLLRLREGVGRDLVPVIDINEPPAECIPDSAIPILLEWPSNHEGFSGGHVLYLDGHREWKNYPGEFPMTVSTITALATLAGHSPLAAYAQPSAADLPENDPYRFIQQCRENLSKAYRVTRWQRSGNPRDMFPKLSPVSGKLMMLESEIFPEYVIDPKFLVCPGPQPIQTQPHFDDSHYVYFGYLMVSDADVDAFAQAYAAEIASGGDFSSDLPVPTSYGDSLLRLREGVHGDLFIDVDPSSEGFVGDHKIPVMMEWPGQHEGLTGGHVLYMDGHIEFIDFPGKFPMTAHAMDTLASIASWQSASEWAHKASTLDHDPHLQALCEDNLRSIGVSFDLFANVNRDFFPALSNVPARLMFEFTRMVPFHIGDVTRLSCPASPFACATPSADDQSYVYPGYVLMTDGDVAAFASAYNAVVSMGGDFKSNLPGNTSYGTEIYRIEEGVERLLVGIPAIANPSPGGIAVLIEWPENHDELRGGNVLYMDGHVEWIEYPGKFPMTVATMNILTNLAGRSPIQ